MWKEVVGAADAAAISVVTVGVAVALREFAATL